MEMLEKINIALKEIDENLEINYRFKGGMSNFTYLVSNKIGEKFVFRYPEENNYNFVDYILLEKVLKQTNKLECTNECIYFNSKTGVKLSKYIEGKNISDDVDLKDVVKCLKQVHNSKMVLKKYDHIGRLEKYEKLHGNNLEAYYLMKKQWIKIYDNHLKSNVKFPTHGDAQFSNLIQVTGEVKIIDWEFCALNDYIYDIASFGNIDFKKAIKLIKEYETEISEEKFIRLYGWRIFQCLQWYNVALAKHEMGLSKKLEIPFDKVSKKYLKLVEELLKEVNIKYLNR